jgi:hypothetical protein
MRIVSVRPFVTPIVVVVAVLAMCATGCEQEEITPLPTTAPSPSSRVSATRRALPTSDEIFGSRAATAPSTLPTAAVAVTTTQSSITDVGGSSSIAREPTDTPDQTITKLFELMQKQDVAGVRAMLADPPSPERLRTEVAMVAERLSGGAKWEILHSRTEGVAAVVIFRTNFPDGKEEFTPLPLVNRYERWRVLMGALNPKKLTAGERTGINRLAPWTEQRMNELRGVPTTKPGATEPGKQ